MHRGSLVVAVLSLIGGVLSLAIAAALGDPLSLYIVLAVVLFANAAVRYQIARRAVRHVEGHAGYGYPPADRASDGGE